MPENPENPQANCAPTASANGMTRREAVCTVAGAAVVAAAAAHFVEGAPAILSARADSNAVKFGMVGTGSRGSYLLKHLKNIHAGTCVAICDINDAAMNKAQETYGGSPKRYKDYRDLLEDKNVEAVFVTTPLSVFRSFFRTLSPMAPPRSPDDAKQHAAKSDNCNSHSDGR